MDDLGWYSNNSDNRTHPIGKKQPNDLGLYDMSGNVWEWCFDKNEDHRGGSWLSEAESCHVSSRNLSSPGNRYSNIGFRLALSL